MDFFELEEYTKKDIDDLIQNEVEESIYLDYKDGRALDPDKIAEITKDVSAFANADGGIIVYGVSENKATHKPEGYATVTNPKITKEWLEQKNCLIRRKIDGVLIFPIRLEGNPNDSIYVVKIPRSNNAPHMALDNKYYKRHNFSSDPMEVVREGKSLRSRRYRNRRLGEFLKELDLTEGRATGIPTIQDELKANGSTKATIETDEERTYFLIDIPCHPGFMKETLSVEQIGVKGGVKEPNVTKDVTKNVTKDVTKNVTKDVTKDVTKELTERQSVILEMITEDSFVTIPEMSLKTGVATRTIKRDIENLQSSDILTRKGGRKDGEWIVTELGMAMLEALKK